MTWVRQTPRWVYAVCALYLVLQPATHWCAQRFAPEHLLPTGILNPDTTIYVHAMHMFETGFHSPYATCRSPFGDHSPRLFTTPFYILYGVAGVLARGLAIDPPAFLPWANGFGAACYLLAAYHFMRTVAPDRAGLGFAFYACLGGVGGVLYLLCAALGITQWPDFDRWFYRFAIYDLLEGQTIAPYLLATRLYYTLPLALGYAGLTTIILTWRMRCAYHVAYASSLLLAAGLLNARLSAPLACIAALYAIQHQSAPLRRLIQAAGPLFIGALTASLVMRLNPAFVANTVAVVRQAMWPTSFLSASLPLLVLAGPILLRAPARGPLRLAYFATAGYIAAFALLFLAYQLYYGTLLAGPDHAAAARISDPALLGACAGALLSLRRPARAAADGSAWLAVWLLLLVGFAASAFGQGWFLQFAPQRLMVFMGVPLALLAAESVAVIRRRWGRAAVIPRLATLACGLCAVAVTTLVFQGPLGMGRPLPDRLGLRAAYLTSDEAACVSALNEGIVLAPPPYNDILSLRPGRQVIGGFGSVGLSDAPSAVLDADVQSFFNAATSNETRAQILEDWCVTYVFAPASYAPIARQLELMNGLREFARSGDVRVFAVDRSTTLAREDPRANALTKNSS